MTYIYLCFTVILFQNILLQLLICKLTELFLNDGYEIPDPQDLRKTATIIMLCLDLNKSDCTASSDAVVVVSVSFACSCCA